MSVSLRYVGIAIASIGFVSSPAAAQIVPDNTLGAENSQVIRDRIDGLESDRIEGGAIRGDNLFHSFDRFNVGEGRAAYFSNPTGIDSIFGRVTGSDVSNILGRLGVLGAADLYLINPNGIVFGENASLDVSGSFTATTSNAIEFGDRGVFDATNPTAPSSLLTINPSAYLFTQSNAESIVNRASIPVDSTSGLSFGLLVLPTETLTLLGGNVRLNGGSLTALSGQIEIGAIEGIGRVQVNPNGRLIFPNDLDRADVSLTNSGTITTLGGGGGTIRIHANDLTITQGTIAAGIAPGFGSETAQAGDVVLDATGNIRMGQALSGGGTVPSVGIANEVLSSAADGFGVGNSGNIMIRGDSLLIQNSRLSASTFGVGNSGSIRLNIANEIHLENTRIETGVGDTGFGQTGDIQIRAGGQIGLLDRTVINVNSRSAFFLEGTPVDFDRLGNASTVRITGRSLEIDNSQITVAVNEFSNPQEIPIGFASNITIDVAEEIELLDSNLDDEIFSGIASQIASNALGRGGNLTIRARSFAIAEGGISASNLTGSNGLSADLDLPISTFLFRFSEFGQSGNIRVRVDDRFETENGQVLAIGTVLGGDIAIEAGEILLRGDTTVSSFAGVRDAGGIRLNADAILAFDDSNIAAFSLVGRGGNIALESPAFFAENYQLSSTTIENSGLSDRSSLAEIVQFSESDEFDAFTDERANFFNNDRVNVDASGAISGGEIAIPDVSLVQNSLVEIPENAIDTNALLANSCIARTPNRGSFVITGSGNLPARPGDEFASPYSTGTVRSIPDAEPSIEEPQGIYTLPDGRIVMSRECEE